MFLFAAKLNSARNVLSYKAGDCLPDREPWLLLAGLLSYTGMRTLPKATTGFAAKIYEIYFLRLKIRN